MPWNDDSTLDAEHELIRVWRRSATVKLEAGQFEEAEQLFEAVAHHSKVRYGPLFEGRAEITKSLTKVYDKLGKWEKLENTLLGELEENHSLHTLYRLAEACLGKGDVNQAERWCRRACRGLEKNRGLNNIRYYQCLDLRARICEAGGPSKRLEVEGYRSLIPADVLTGMTS